MGNMCHPSNIVPWTRFKLQSHVNDSKSSKTICQVRGGNAQLGNRYKNRYGFKYDVCPHCESKGLNIKLTKQHVIFECPVVAIAQKRFIHFQFSV